MSNHVSVRLSQADSFGTTDFTGLHVVPHFLNVLLLGKTGCNAFAGVDVLFCKKSQSGSTVCFLSVLTLAPWAPLCSKRSHIQLDRREVWRQTARVACLPHTSSLQVYLVPARRQLMRQWTRDLITCRWMKLEFSSCKTNTMWPCWVSDCVIGVPYWSREEGLKEWANFSQNMVRNGA